MNNTEIEKEKTIEKNENKNENENTNEQIEKKDVNEKIKHSKKIRTRIVIIIALIAAIVSYVMFRGNYLEMKELGENYLNVFWQNTIYFIVTFVLNFAFIFFAFYFTNRKIHKGLKIFFDDENKEMPKFPNKSISFIIALFGSLFTSQLIVNKLLLCFSNSQFGITDPIFNLDISFMVFQKPLIQFLIVYLFVIIVATLAYAMIYSIILLNVSFDGVSRESITKTNLVEKIGSRVKILALLIAFFIIFFMVTNIGNEKFMGIELSDGTSYSLYGAGMTDATIKVWGYLILALIAMYSIIKGYKALKEKNIGKVLKNIMIVPVYLIVLAGVLALYQLIFIGSNQLASNEKYIENNINYTKEAYGISIDEDTIDYSGTVTKQEISNNTNLLDNIDIITSSNVLQDLETSKNSKGYYTYRNTQIEQYKINGKNTLVYITPREISNSNTSYANKTYQYTHGYGATVTLAGDTDENGNLRNIEKDFGELSNEKIPIKQPRIYYGLENNNVAVINKDKKEIDYIEEDLNNEVTYNFDGNAGLNLNFLDRLVLSFKLGDFRIAFSGDVNDDSKIMTNRNIIERAKKVMPDLKYDSKPYMIVDDSGNQYWVIDAYTVSNEYPFSQKINLNAIEEINYIRNSVKVIINAYDGNMKFYITDRKDPIAMAYNNIYPTLFEKEENGIPQDISKHFAYPQMLYNIQSNIIQQYHGIKSEVFYRGNDIWEIAKTTSSGKEEYINPYYTMVKNDEGNDTLGLIIPYTDYDKQNLRAYLVAYYNNGNAKLKLIRFSSNSNVLGPIQLETQINQDENIATEIASLNTTGTRITKQIIAVPINNTLLYVETIYQQLINETTQKPTLKKVVVASGNKVAIGNNLSLALENLLSQSAVDIDVSDNENIQDLVNAVVKANQNVNNSSKSGDWKLFGEDMQKLTNLINQLQTAVEKQKTLKNSTDQNNQQNQNSADNISDLISNSVQ